MRNRIGGALAAGFLCLVAATIGVWSGPLASASGALHADASSPAHVAAVHATAVHGTAVHGTAVHGTAVHATS